MQSLTKQKQYQREYKKTEKYKEYAKNYEKTSLNRKRYKESEKYKDIQKKYQQSEKYKEALRLRGKSEAFKKYQREYHKKRRSTNIQVKIAFRLRIRLNESLRGNYKSGSAIRDLGCSITELKEYLEKKFQEGMNWSNHGSHGWHIDHIKPLASFNLEDRNELLIACNYKNLQPLWAKDNSLKGSKI